jgi:hypothetical protein
MSSINKRFSSLLGIIFYVVIVFIVIRFFIYMLPFILVISIVGWLGIKWTRAIKLWNNKRRNGGNTVNNVDITKDDTLDDLSNKQVIDVEYKDVE